MEMQTEKDEKNSEASPVDRWLEFSESFLAEDEGEPRNPADEGNNENSQTTFNYGAKLGDLSCSLLDCVDELHDDGNGNLEESTVENLVAKLRQRDNLIAKLTSVMKNMSNHKGNGDSILNSVEKNLESFADGLKNSNFLTTPTHSISANVVSTQTENFEDELDACSKQSRSPHQDVGTSVCPRQSPEIHKPDSNFSAGEPQHDDDVHQEVDDEHEAVVHQSPRRLSFAMNPDALRLTFSPSICEYESESYGGNDLFGPGGYSTLEDLRLQIMDFERKLESEKRFLREMTVEREQEREEYQRTINTLALKYEEGKREKEKMENVLEHHQMEIRELEEHLRHKELVEDQLLNKDYQLQQAVEKVFELREIIRTQEEQIEAMTKHSMSLLDAHKDTTEFLEMEMDNQLQSELCNLVSHQDASCTSEIDHTEELWAQMHELANKVEERLMELENFPWQNRPNSSCSAAGDDISVRGTSTHVKNCDDSSDARDFVSRVFCSLRRLEYSFDGFVRFQEILLKKIKDGDLKILNENKKIEELKTEKGKLALDLSTCRQKIKEFENFLTENNNPNSFANHSIERLRNTGLSFGRGLENTSSPIFRHSQHKNRKNDNESFPINSTTGEMQQLDEMVQVADKTIPTPTAPLIAASSSKPLVAVSPVANTTSGQSASTIPPVSAVPTKSGSGSTEKTHVVKHHPEITRHIGNSALAEDSTREAFVVPPDQRAAETVEATKIPHTETEATELNKIPSTEIKTTTSVGRVPSRANQQSEVEIPGAYSSEVFTDEPKKVSVEKVSSSLSLSPKVSDYENSQVTSEEPTPESKRGSIPTESIPTYGITTVSDFSVAEKEITYLGTQVVPNDSDDLPAAIKSIPTDSNTDVLTFENITETVVDVDFVERSRSLIIPPEDFDAPSVSNEAQISRLEGMDMILELEKLKTELLQMHKALEIEKNKSQVLEEHLNQIMAEGSHSIIMNDGPQGPTMQQQQETGDVSSIRDPTIDQEISILKEKIDDLKCQETKHIKHLRCALLRIKSLQEENDKCRTYITKLQDELQHYATRFDSETDE
ncbi:uncharacterized protein LOC110846590 isoform X2 [Folsomia candida]|uniref:uncharacterized protein LOC110846590 isoform X2 n=1 Tax=Folsomia candida TaxID=158441 RepID=UPI000B8F8A12|nr:uncharacterized protein LOC110846590 isoform X2 [Folsomia candida]